MILASNSPRRYEILSNFGFNIIKLPSNIDENQISKTNVESYVKQIVKLKIDAVANKNTDKYVVAADTVVFLDGEIFGKPKSIFENLEMLEKLNGKKHFVYTGYCFKNVSKKIDEYSIVKSEVIFKNNSKEILLWYANIKEGSDKAGGYGIQGKGCVLIEKIIGDYLNIMGFPLSDFFTKLINLKIKQSDFSTL